MVIKTDRVVNFILSGFTFTFPETLVELKVSISITEKQILEFVIPQKLQIAVVDSMERNVFIYSDSGLNKEQFSLDVFLHLCVDLDEFYNEMRQINQRYY